MREVNQTAKGGELFTHARDGQPDSTRRRTVNMCKDKRQSNQTAREGKLFTHARARRHDWFAHAYNKRDSHPKSKRKGQASCAASCITHGGALHSSFFIQPCQYLIYGLLVPSPDVKLNLHHNDECDLPCNNGKVTCVALFCCTKLAVVVQGDHTHYDHRDMTSHCD